MSGRITPNRGNSPCVCGAIHPCCRFLVDGNCSHLTTGDHHHAATDEAVRRAAGRHGVWVADGGIRVVWRNAGDYEGHHRLPYGCDPEGWPDGLVFWSTSAAQFMRVTGYADEAVS